MKEQTQGEAFQAVCHGLALDISPLSIGRDKHCASVRVASELLADLGDLAALIQQGVDTSDQTIISLESEATIDEVAVEIEQHRYWTLANILDGMTAMLTKANETTGETV